MSNNSSYDNRDDVHFVSLLVLLLDVLFNIALALVRQIDGQATANMSTSKAIIGKLKTTEGAPVRAHNGMSAFVID